MRGTAPVAQGYRWRAPFPDGIAHLFPVRSETRPALCGVRNQPEAHDWPKGRRCAACEKAAQG